MLWGGWDVRFIIKAIDEASKVFDWVWKSVNKMSQEWSKDMQSLWDRMTDFSERNKRTFTAMAVGWAAAFTTIVVAWWKAIDMAWKFETRMSNISTLISWDSTKAVNDLSKWILDMTKSMPKTADDLWASAYSIVSAWVSETADVLNVLKNSTELAVAWLSSTEQATDIMTSSLNAFWYEAWDASRVADILFKTVKFGKTDISQMSQAFGASAPVIASAWISLEEFSAATAALTTSGLPASQAQNSLRQATVSLLKPTKEMSWLLSKAWFESWEAAIKSLWLVWAMDMISDAAGWNSQQLASAWWSVEAFGSAIALTGEQWDAFRDTLNSMTEWSNEIAEAFAKQTQTYEAQKQIFNNSIQAMWISIWTTLLPIAIELLNIVKPIIDRITQRASENEKLAWWIFVWAGALAWLVTVLWIIWLAIPAVVAWFWGLATAIWFVFSPIFLVWAAIVWLAYIIYKNRDDIKIYTNIILDEMASMINDTINRISNARRWVWTWISQFFQQTRQWILDFISFITDWITETFTFWFGLVKSIRSIQLWFVFGTVKTIFNWIREFVKNVLNWIRDTFVWAINMIVAFLWWGWKEQFEAGWTLMMSWIIWIVKSPINAALGMIEWFVNSVIRTINRLIRAAREVWFPIGWGEIRELSLPRFANGGIVRWAKWIDKIPAMVWDWELILNKSQQGSIASLIRSKETTGWVTVQITWNSFYGDDESFAEKIWNTIVSKFQWDFAFEMF